MATMANDHRNVTLAVPVDFPPFETPIDYRIPMHFTDWHAARFVRHDKMPESMLETSRAFRREFAARFGGREKEFWAEAELRILAPLKWKERMEAMTPKISPVEQNGNGTHDIAPKKEDASNGVSTEISAATAAIRPVLHTTRSRTSFSVNISPGPAIFAVHGPAALTTKWHDIHPFILELVVKYFPEEQDPIIRYFCHERRSWPDMGEPTTTLTSNVVKTLAKAIGMDRT